MLLKKLNGDNEITNLRYKTYNYFKTKNEFFIVFAPNFTSKLRFDKCLKVSEILEEYESEREVKGCTLITQQNRIKKTFHR